MWVAQLKQGATDDTIIALAGNKCDCRDEDVSCRCNHKGGVAPLSPATVAGYSVRLRGSGRGLMQMSKVWCLWRRQRRRASTLRSCSTELVSRTCILRDKDWYDRLTVACFDEQRKSLPVSTGTGREGRADRTRRPTGWWATRVRRAEGAVAVDVRGGAEATQRTAKAASMLPGCASPRVPCRVNAVRQVSGHNRILGDRSPSCCTISSTPHRQTLRQQPCYRCVAVAAL